MMLSFALLGVFFFVVMTMRLAMQLVIHVLPGSEADVVTWLLLRELLAIVGRVVSVSNYVAPRRRRRNCLSLRSHRRRRVLQSSDQRCDAASYGIACLRYSGDR